MKYFETNYAGCCQRREGNKLLDSYALINPLNNFTVSSLIQCVGWIFTFSPNKLSHNFFMKVVGGFGWKWGLRLVGTMTKLLGKESSEN